MQVCPQNLPTGVFSHTQMVKSLYKRVLRNLESWYDRRDVYRYHAVMMRARFDSNQCVEDPNVAKQMLLEGEKELLGQKHYHVRKFWLGPGGTCFERDVQPPDWALDYWHPYEKMQYPIYFERREAMKKRLLEKWNRDLKKERFKQECP